jgi:hypothetical protein
MGPLIKNKILFHLLSIFTYAVGIFSALTWFFYGSRGFHSAYEYHDYDKVRAYIWLAIFPLIMGVASIAAPVWIRWKRTYKGKHADAAVCVLTCLFLIWPWAIMNKGDLMEIGVRTASGNIH